jgi:DNA-binding NarL/FixJ family response regulator
MKRLEFLIIDDDRIYALGLKAWLKGLGLAQSTRAVDAVPYGDEFAEPDLVLVDPQMAGVRYTGMIREVKRRYPRCRLVVLSTSQWFEEGFAGNSMDAGADAFFCKGQPDEELFMTLLNLIDSTPDLRSAVEHMPWRTQEAVAS